jgi:rare lipoprotein A
MKYRAERSHLRAAGLALLLALAGCAGGRHRLVPDTPVKIGKPYQVRGTIYYPADDTRYDETGLASWYGPGQHGTTANGERFDGRRVGAAHKTLPLPSYVEVTALATGRRIIVRVNDRGPFVPGRIIDLSYAAAELLGVVRTGTARVRVRRVYPNESIRRALRSGRPAAPLPTVPHAAIDPADRLARAAPLGYQPFEQAPQERTDPSP